MPDAAQCPHISLLKTPLHVLSLTALPTEILANIVAWLTHRSLDLTKENPYQKAHTPAFCFRPNHLFSNLTRSYDDLVALSSTCTSLRVFLGPVLFRYLSLIRVSEFDALLACPKSFERFSDTKKYQREYLKEVLHHNSAACGATDLAGQSFGAAVKGDARYISRYQSFSANNYVQIIEVDNSLLKSHDMRLFANVKAVKVLDKAYKEPQLGANPREVNPSEYPKNGDINQVRFANLRFLSVNISTLFGLEVLFSHIPHLHRLDLLCEFNALDADLVGRFSSSLRTLPENNLVELNLFISASAALRYKAVLDLLDTLLRGHLTICSVNIRLIRRNTVPEVKGLWEIYDEADIGHFSGQRLVEVLKSCPNLRSVGLDLQILRSLSFPLVPEELFPSKRHSGFCCTFIDRTVHLPTFEGGPLASMAYLISSFQADRVCFQYGETAEGSRLHALTLMRSLVAVLRSPLDQSQAYFGVNTISLEKAWSMVQENAERDEYFELLESYEATHAQDDYRAILKASTTDRYSMHVPVYRVREIFEAGSTLVYLPGAPDTDSCSNSQAFWSVEASLCEMEQYCLTPKQRSGLWDTV